MKIIKEFEDTTFLDKPDVSSSTLDNEGHKWIWGLGSDGDLYYRCTKFSKPDTWFVLKYSDVARSINIYDMKRIVNEFGHLLVFL